MKNQKVYIKGDSSRGFDVINELVKLGANNPSNHYGDVCFNYYYIDKQNNIRAVEDVNLLKDSGYREIPLPPPCDVLPFRSSEELEKACDEHGNMVRNKNGVYLFEVSRIMSLVSSYHSDQEAYKHLLEFYEFRDGAPCGVVVQKQ